MVFTVFASPSLAGEIPCVTGEIAKNGTVINAPQGSREGRTSIAGEPMEGVDGIQQTTLGDIKRNQLVTNTALSMALSRFKRYCREMYRKDDCDYAKRVYRDEIAWAYNSQTPIDCKYLSIVSKSTHAEIVENPIQFLKKSRFSWSSARLPFVFVDWI